MKAGPAMAALVMGWIAAVLMFAAAAIFARQGNPAWPLMVAAGVVFVIGGHARHRRATQRTSSD